MLSWQWDWAGPRLQNKRILVCPACLDKPQEQLRSIVLPADPLPIMNSRQDPYMYMGQSSAISAIDNSSQNVTPTPAYIAPGYQGYIPTTALSFDSASAAAVTLSNSNMTAVNTGTTATEQGVKVLSAKTTGQLYFEVRLASLNGTGQSNLQTGVDLNSDSYTTAGSTSSNGTMLDTNGTIWSKGSNSGDSINFLSQGDVIGIAVDLDNLTAWFRKTPGGFWNGSVTADPGTNTGGVAISSQGVEPFAIFGGTNGTSSNAWTINTNAALFTGAMPLGFTAWSS